MTNQFKKLLKNEFGISIYRKFFVLINERIMSGKINYIGDKLVDIENNSVYKEMCSILKTKDRECLMKMQEKLNKTMVNSMAICRGYIIVLLMYGIGMIAMMTAVASPYFAYLGMICLTLVYLYKTIEYVLNRYCVIDAQMVIIYKNALDKILSGNAIT